jgi:RHS repeat-associated protein
VSVLSLGVISTLLVSPVTLPHEPSAQVPEGVNIISGDLQATIDHVVVGPEPIPLFLDVSERFTVTVTEKRNKAFFELIDESGEKSSWALPEKWGLHANDPRKWTMRRWQKPWSTNADSGVISQKRPIIRYDYYSYTFTLEKPGGEKRIYRCFKPASDNLKRAIGKKKNKDTLVEVFHLSEVELPNGNRLLYKYDGERLERIEAVNSSGKVLTWAEIRRQGGAVEVTGSDGSIYRHEGRADVTTDSKGRVTSLGDARYSYDYDNCRTTVQVGDRVYMYSYSLEGRILSVEVDGVEERFHWNGRRLVAKTLSCNDSLIYRRDFEYDRNCNLARERLTGDLTGSGIHETYEVRVKDTPKLISEEDDEKRITWAYENGQLLRHSIYDHGELVSEERFEYDEDGQLARIGYQDAVISRVDEIVGDEPSDEPVPSTSPEIRTPSGWIAPEFTLAFDPLGNLISQTNPLGEKARFSYTCRGQIKEIEYADGTREQRRYSKSGHLISETSRTGKMTTYTRDGLGRLLSTSEGDEYAYSGCFLARQGDRTSYQYDDQGHPMLIECGEVVTEIGYDDQGRRVSELVLADGQNISSFWEYDDEGRVIRQWSEADGDICSDQSFVYDPEANLILTTVGEGLTEEIGYDHQGRAVRHVNPAGGTTITSYDEVLLEEQLVQRARVTDPSGTTTISLHDGEGRLVQEEIRDLLDRPLHRRDLYYDLLGRVIQEAHLVHTPDGPDRTYTNTWTYGLCGRLLTHTESGETQQSTTSYGHDEYGRVTSIVRPGGVTIEIEYDGEGLVSRYGDYTFIYDDRGNLIQSASPQGTIDRDYDLLGRLTRETFPTGLSVGYAYDDLGRVTSLILPDGSSVAYERDGPHLKSVHRQSETCEYEHRYLEYDLLGRPTLEELPLSAGELTRSYDAHGLRSIHHAHFEEEVTSRDSLGNPLTLADGDSYAFDGQNRLCRDGDREFTYDSLHNRRDFKIDELNRLPDCDLQGNLLSHGDQRYSYDVLGRLTHIETDDALTEFTYDAFDRCLSRTHFDRSSYDDWTISSHSDYFYMGMMELGASIDGRITELRVLGVGIGADIGSIVAIELDGKPYTPLSDRRGCIRALLDGTEVIERYAYTAFGEETTTGTLNPYRFMSKRTESGLVNFGHRFYLPSLGRFLTPDPARDGANLYAFVHGNPLSSIDLFGYEGVADNWGALHNQYSVSASDQLVVKAIKWIWGCFFGKKNRPVQVHVNVGTGTTDTFPSPPAQERKQQPQPTSSPAKPAPVKRRDGSVPPVCRPTVKRAGAVVYFSPDGRQRGRPLGAINFRYTELAAGDFAAMVRHQDGVQEGLEEECCYYTLEGVQSAWLGIGYVNGMLTTFLTALYGAGYISEMFAGMEIDGVYNGTGGLEHDLRRARKEIFDFAAFETVGITHGNWDRFFARAEPGGVYIQFCNSEGAPIVRNALMCYDPELRMRIIVIAIAPAAYMIPGTCLEAVHFASTSDLVPRFDSIGRSLAGNSVRWLQPHPSVKGMDHGLRSPTYYGPVRELAELYMERYSGGR